MSCFRCKYFEKPGMVATCVNGFCKRYPPSLFSEDDDDELALYPMVRPNDWCGEFIDNVTGKKYV